MSIILHARKQHDAFFRSMAQGGRWHLYRAPGTDNVALMREDAQWDVPVWPVMVPDVHAMTSAQLAARVQSIVRA
jgi:hypothetical protein